MEWEEVMAAAEAFVSLQQEHQRRLQGGELGSIFAWQRQRRDAFVRLRAAVSELVPRIKKREDGVLLQELLAAVMAGEHHLAVAAAARREEMSANLARIRQGRRGISGYRTASGVEPRVLQGRM
ncbi:MAG: hypothetical protein AB1568_01240 [Thermodesulfobacteriota bacterium]